MSAKTARKPSVKRILNRRAQYDYELGDSLEVGLVLNGAETKNLRMNRGQLQGAYVAVNGDELWLIGARIAGSNGIPLNEDEQTRSRKLLARRKQIDKLIAMRKQGMTIVPTEINTKGRYIKLRIALGKGKKRYDKRETIKRREQQRQAKSLTNL
jgi:SsrA-binding protein